MRTAESVVLTDWPPGPDERLTSIRRSFSSSISTSTSSASGMTTTVDGRGVDPAARLGRRDALDAVDAALELEAAVGAVAADLDDGLLDPVDAGLVHAHDLGLVPVPAGVARVHPEQLGREQRGLVATGPGPDLEDDVAIVVRVARQEEHLELLDAAASRSSSSRSISSRAMARISSSPSPASPSSRTPGQLRPDRLEPAVGRDGGLEPGELLAELADQVRVGAGLRPRELGLEVVVLERDLGQRGVEVAHASGGVSPGLAVRDRVRGLASGSSVGLAQLHRRPVEVGRSRRDLVAVGDERLLHRGDGDLDHVVGRALGRDHLDEDARVHDHADDRVVAELRARA